MLYWLADFSDKLQILNVFRYLTVRTGGSMMTAALFVFLFGPWMISHLRIRQLEASNVNKRKDHAIDSFLSGAVGAHTDQEPFTCFTLYLAFERGPGA